MSEESGNGKGLFILVFIVVPVLYIALRLLPYVVFYIAPFALASLLMGWLWKMGCQAEITEYKRIVVFFPITVVILILTIDFPIRIPEKFQNENYIESPAIYGAFNDMRSAIEGFINWTWASNYRFIFGSPIIPPEKYEPFQYDKSDLSWVLWLAICIGAPAFFLCLAKKDDDGRIAELEATFEAKIKEEQGKASGYFHDMKRTENWAKITIEEKDKEIAKLKAVAQFAKPQALPETMTSNGEASSEGKQSTDTDGKGPKKPNIFDVL